MSKHPYTKNFQGNAWNPDWDEDQEGFSWKLVLTPPSVTHILSEGHYFDLMAQRLEWHIYDWIENYADEMNVEDINNPQQVKAATLALIYRRLPDEFSRRFGTHSSLSSIANCIVADIRQHLRGNLFSKGTPNFPITVLSERERVGSIVYCIQHEMTLDGWLLELQ